MRTILTAIFILFVNVLYSQVETRYFDEPANLEKAHGSRNVVHLIPLQVGN